MLCGIDPPGLEYTNGIILEDILEDTDNLVNSIWHATQLVAVVTGGQALFGIR